MSKATPEETKEAFDRLDNLRREAEAGAPDPYLAKEAKTTVYAVRRWRKKRGLTRKRGPARKLEMEHYAMSVLGRPVEDAMHRTSASPVDGRWEPPEYVLRGEVDYESLIRQLHFLHRRGGFPLDRIAKAHGYTLRTVQQAIAIGDRMEEED